MMMFSLFTPFWRVIPSGTGCLGQPLLMGWAGLDLPGERGGLFGPCVATDNHGRDPSPIPSRRIPRRTHPPLPLPSPLHARVGRTREPLVAVAAAVPSPEGERDEEEEGGKMKTTKGGKVMNPTDAFRKEQRKKELKRVSACPPPTLGLSPLPATPVGSVPAAIFAS